jgi:hypothetical protein
MAEPGWRDRLLAAAGTRLQAWGARLLARAAPEAQPTTGSGPPEHWLALLEQSEVPLDWQGVDAAAWERAAVETLAHWRVDEPHPEKAAPGQRSEEPAPETARRRRPPPSVQFEPPTGAPPEATPDFGPAPTPPQPPRVVFAGWETASPSEPDLPAAGDRPPRPPAAPPPVIEQAATSKPAPPSWPERSARQSRLGTAPEQPPGARSPEEVTYDRPPERPLAAPPAFTKPAARVTPQPRFVNACQGPPERPGPATTARRLPAPGRCPKPSPARRQPPAVLRLRRRKMAGRPSSNRTSPRLPSRPSGHLERYGRSHGARGLIRQPTCSATTRCPRRCGPICRKCLPRALPKRWIGGRRYCANSAARAARRDLSDGTRSFPD